MDFNLSLIPCLNEYSQPMDPRSIMPLFYKYFCKSPALKWSFGLERLFYKPIDSRQKSCFNGDTKRMDTRVGKGA